MVHTLHEMIRLGLDTLGQEELVHAAELPPGALQAAQRGELGAWDLAMTVRLAEVVGVDPALALSGGALPVPRLVALLRESPWGLLPQDTLALRGALSRAGALRRAGLQPARTYRPTQPRGNKAWEDGYRAARRLRRDLGCPDGPLTDLRGQVEKELGVLVCAVALQSPGVEAVAIADETGAAIVLNTEELRPASHLRRSIAHELCHLLFDPRTGTCLLDTIQSTDDARVEPREQRARAFAAELLVPGAALDRLRPAGPLGTDRARALALQICEEFGAPWELVVFHLHNHGLLDEPTRDLLRRERLVPQATLGIGSPAALRWAQRQVQEGELSAGRARVLLGSAWPDGDGLPG